MTLPYSSATSGNRALDDIQKLLTKFGVSRFGTMTDNEHGEIAAISAPTIDDPRLSYIEVQIERDELQAVDRAIARALEGK